MPNLGALSGGQSGVSSHHNHKYDKDYRPSEGLNGSKALVKNQPGP